MMMNAVSRQKIMEDMDRLVFVMMFGASYCKRRIA